MSPARLPSASVLPLFSPPCRIALRCSRRPRLPDVPRSSRALLHSPQCRSFQLYLTARTRTVLGMHKVLPFERYYTPDLDRSEHRIELFSPTEGELIAADLTLEKVYNDYVKPGHILYLRNPPGRAEVSGGIEKMKARNLPTKHRSYTIVKAHSTSAQVVLQKPKYTKTDNTQVKQHAALRIVCLMLCAPVNHMAQMLDKAYRFIEAGCPVEFTVRFPVVSRPKKEQLLPGPKDLWPWVHDHFPHLRPDFICKAMPKGTYFHVEPFSDGRSVKWVLALPTQAHQLNWTRRLLKVKKAVMQSIAQGRQSGLPMALRGNLTVIDNEVYSTNSMTKDNDSTNATSKETRDDSILRRKPGASKTK